VGGTLPGVAAIEQPDEPAAEERAGQRVARTDPVTAVFSRRVRPGLETWFDLPGPDGAPVVTGLLRRLLRRTPEAW
jgi:hypothetical protein